MENQRFRHVTSWAKESLTIGTVYDTNFDESNYWKCKLRENLDISSPMIDLNKLIDPILSLLGKSIDLTFFTKEIQKAKYYSEGLKEYIFEDIRRREFSERPSRRKCMFLIPNEADVHQYCQRLGFNIADKNIVEVEILDTAKLHWASLSELDCNSFSHDEKESAARRYWSGNPNRDLSTEILYEGQFTITKIC